MHYTHIIIPKCGSTLNACSNDFVCRYVGVLNVWCYARGKIALRIAVRSEAGVADEGRVIDAAKFHSWSKYATPLTNVNSDWMSNASSGLWIILHYIMRILYFASWGVTTGALHVTLPKLEIVIYVLVWSKSKKVKGQQLTWTKYHIVGKFGGH